MLFSFHCSLIQIAFVRFDMWEAEPLCAENIGLKDITRSRRGELIMYYRTSYGLWLLVLISFTEPDFLVCQKGFFCQQVFSKILTTFLSKVSTGI